MKLLGGGGSEEEGGEGRAGRGALTDEGWDSLWGKSGEEVAAEETNSG